MNTLPTVSVIIATHNRLPFLRNCLNSLWEQTYPKDLTEVIVVDDGSTDETPHYLKSVAENVPFIKVITKPHGWQSQARNEGIKASQNEFIAIVDDDCTLDKNWLLTMVNSMDHYQADAAGGSIHAPGENTVIQFLDYISALNPPLLPNGNPKYIVTASGIFRRKVFYDVGLFDEMFASAGGEDVEFSIRLNRKLRKLKFLPEAKSLHWYKPNIADFLRRYYRYGYGARLAFDKHQMWDHWLPRANATLQKILCGKMYVRNFAEIDDINLRLWFGILHILKRFCFLAGYIHITDLSQLDMNGQDGQQLFDTRPESIAKEELTAALLTGLSGLPTSLCPNGDGWSNELHSLASHYQRAIERKDVQTWTSHICQILDWNYILTIATGVFSPSILPSVPDQKLSPITKFVWLGYHKYRDETYRRKFSSITKKLPNKRLTPKEIEDLCHAYRIDVNRFREWYGNYLAFQSNWGIVALWPFWRRPKPRPQPSSYPSSPSSGGEGPGYW